MTTLAGPTKTATALGVAAAAMSAAMGTATAAATLVFGDLLGTAWAGVPAMLGIVGTAGGSTTIARLVSAHGPRLGLGGGYLLGAAGIALAAVVTLGGAGAVGSAVVVAVGMVLLGVGNAAAQLSRYVAAERHGPERQGSAIALVVWITTVGAVGGPLLLGPATRLANAAEGAFALAACCAALAAIVVATVPGSTDGPVPAPDSGPPPAVAPAPPRLFATPTARRAFAAMAAAQVVMVAVMTAAPMSLHMHGSTTTVIGAVLSAHTFGMFAPSPITGLLVDRWGPIPVVGAGFAVLVLASVGTTLSAGGSQAIALFLLGFGWNLCFIAGSGVLAAGLPAAGKLAVEARVEAAVWLLAAVAAMLSTVLLSAGGTVVLAGVATAIVAVAALVVRVGVR